MNSPITPAMSIWQIIRRLFPYVRPYRILVASTLILTLIGSLTAQVNPFVLRYIVDKVQGLLHHGHSLKVGLPLLLGISGILLAKELLNAALDFGQSYFGEKIWMYVSSALSQDAVRRILSYRLGFYAAGSNQTGKLQTRLDKGVDALMKLVQDLFIDIMPMLAAAVVPLAVIFAASWRVGLVALAVLPVYFWLSYRQAVRLSGVRRGMRQLKEDKNHGLLNLMESAVVIRSFVREGYEEEKQDHLQRAPRETQLRMRKTNFLFNGLKSLVEQVGLVAIIVLTAYLVLSHELSIGTIMFNSMLFHNVSAPIRQLHQMYDELNEVHTYF